jgi:1,4-dihydroxy-6-naphthoate synthase
LNAIRRDLPPEVLKEADELLESSIRYALEHRDEALTFAMKYSGGLPRALADKFVGMYVNGLTQALGDAGRKGLALLYERGIKAGLLPASSRPEFVRA